MENNYPCWPPLTIHVFKQLPYAPALHIPRMLGSLPQRDWHTHVCAAVYYSKETTQPRYPHQTNGCYSAVKKKPMKISEQVEF